MIKVSTSWSKLSNINEQIWPHEKIEFRTHDQKFDLMKKLNFDLMKFDLMKKLNFDLMKFDLMIISLLN